MTTTRTPRDVVERLTTTPHDTWVDGLGHGVTMDKKGSNLALAGAAAEFLPSGQKTIHRTPHVLPLYVYQSVRQKPGLVGMEPTSA